jgi:hypothetical protein
MLSLDLPHQDVKLNKINGLQNNSGFLSGGRTKNLPPSGLQSKVNTLENVTKNTVKT